MADGMGAADRHLWQSRFRRSLSDVMGGLHRWERPPLAAKVCDSVSLDGYRRESVAFTTRHGLQACGYFLIPDGVDEPRPAVLCLPGHGRGVDVCVGIAADGSQRKLGEPDEYASDFALQCVAMGYPAFVLEMISFGVRRDPDIQALGRETTSCARDSMAALMLGETLAGWRVWDAMRALDYLETRDDIVDASRLAVMGISGGAMIAYFLAALDPRVAAAIVSCYFNLFATSVLSVDHCVDNFIPGLLNLCEMPDIAALIAPRALFVEGGSEDPIFPHAGFEAAVARAREIYAAFGAETAFGAQEFEGGHQFHGVAALAFLAERMTDALKANVV